MAVRVGEIVEVSFRFPDGQCLVHPAVVLSTSKLQIDEDGLFYAVLISSKNHFPEYTIEIKNEWLTSPLFKQSYFVTHFLQPFTEDEILKHCNTSVRKPYIDMIISKTIKSIFNWEVL